MWKDPNGGANGREQVKMLYMREPSKGNIWRPSLRLSVYDNSNSLKTCFEFGLHALHVTRQICSIVKFRIWIIIERKCCHVHMAMCFFSCKAFTNGKGLQACLQVIPIVVQIIPEVSRSRYKQQASQLLD